ncbi:MAG: glutamine--fructose-6-phosphate transaminase (isomerizing) [Treponema sp.]
MCGIVGYVGSDNAVPYLVNGLKKLEYRGYDSAGIVIGKIVDAKPQFLLYKKVGKLKQLINILPENLSGVWGIGHTRWATHGQVTDKNAHPFISNNGKIAVVHNGIIENFQTLRAKLQKDGIKFTSETDSETIPNLIQQNYNGNLLKAVQEALHQVIGTYALAVTCVDEPNKIVVAKRGGPLVIGIADGAYYIASDVNAIVGNTSRVIYLEDGDIVEVKPYGLEFPEIQNNDYAKRVEEITINAEETEKCGFDTYMEKEINEQPESIQHAFAGRIDLENLTARLSGFDDEIFKKIEKITTISAGTSYYASLFGNLLFEKYVRIPSCSEFSSEFRYKNPIIQPNDVFLAVSQSGETADTIEAMKEIHEKGGKVYGICNVVSSTIARISDGGAFIHAGPEIAVASTKAFSNTLIVYYLLALKFARQRGMGREEGEKFIKELQGQPALIKKALSNKEKIHAIAKKYCKCKDFLFLGRGIMYPIALEGALKLKEISYIHAEAFAAGEIKHGPIAMVNENVPSVFLVPDDFLREKIISNIKEIKARKGPVIAIGIEDDEELKSIVDDFIPVPKVQDSAFYALPMVTICQLFAFYCARELGHDVDQPRNLAKSVTVE